MEKNSKTFEESKVEELKGDISLGEDEHKNLDQALRSYLKAADKDPDNVPLLIKIGKCQDRKREYEKSAASYTKVLEKDPKNYNVQFKLGWSLFRAGKVEQGLQAMRDGLKNGADSAQNLTKLGEILMREGKDPDLEEAQHYLIRSLDKEPKSVDTLVCLGRVYEKQGELDMARERYQ